MVPRDSRRSELGTDALFMVGGLSTAFQASNPGKYQCGIARRGEVRAGGADHHSAV